MHPRVKQIPRDPHHIDPESEKAYDPEKVPCHRRKWGARRKTFDGADSQAPQEYQDERKTRQKGQPLRQSGSERESDK